MNTNQNNNLIIANSSSLLSDKKDKNQLVNCNYLPTNSTISNIKSVRNSIINLYLSVKIRKQDDIAVYNNFLKEKEIQYLKKVPIETIISYIKSSIEILVNIKSNESKNVNDNLNNVCNINSIVDNANNSNNMMNTSVNESSSSNRNNTTANNSSQINTCNISNTNTIKNNISHNNNNNNNYNCNCNLRYEEILREQELKLRKKSGIEINYLIKIKNLETTIIVLEDSIKKLKENIDALTLENDNLKKEVNSFDKKNNYKFVMDNLNNNTENSISNDMQVSSNFGPYVIKNSINSNNYKVINNNFENINISNNNNNNNNYQIINTDDIHNEINSMSFGKGFKEVNEYLNNSQYKSNNISNNNKYDLTIENKLIPDLEKKIEKQQKDFEFKIENLEKSYKEVSLL